MMWKSYFAAVIFGVYLMTFIFLLPFDASAETSVAAISDRVRGIYGVSGSRLVDNTEYLSAFGWTKLSQFFSEMKSASVFDFFRNIFRSSESELATPISPTPTPSFSSLPISEDRAFLDQIQFIRPAITNQSDIFPVVPMRTPVSFVISPQTSDDLSRRIAHLEERIASLILKPTALSITTNIDEEKIKTLARTVVQELIDQRFASVPSSGTSGTVIVQSDPDLTDIEKQLTQIFQRIVTLENRPIVGNRNVGSAGLNLNGELSVGSNATIGGNTTITGALTAMSFSASSTSITTLKLDDGSLGSPSFSFTSDTNTGIYRGGADILRFVTGGADRVTIDSIGNVGIGTTSPTGLLETYSSAGDTQLTITSNKTNNDPFISFRTGATNITPTQQFQIGIDQSDSNKFKIATSTFGTNDFLTIDSSGNVGIGTASPQDNLHIQTAVQDYGGEIVLTNQTTALPPASDNHLGALWFGSSEGSGYKAAGIKGIAELDFSAADWPSALTFWTTPDNSGTPAEVMRITRNGNVGIGTKSPEGILDVIGGSSNIRLKVTTTDTTDPYNLGVSTSAGQKIILSTEAGANRGAVVFGDVSIATNTLFGVSNSSDSGTTWNPRFVIKKSGNVGIGTTGPTSLLELSKTDASPILTITSATSTTTYDPYIAFRTGAAPSIQSLIGIDYSDANKLKLVRGSDIATSTGITIDSSGNVGIGTTGPTHALTFPSGSGGAETNTGIALYNTADQTTNYERVRLFWSHANNVFRIQTEAAGTGVGRNIELRPGSRTSSFGNFFPGADNTYVLGDGNARWNRINVVGIESSISLATTPGYRFSPDTDTGMFSPSADNLGFSTAGAERVRIDTSGNVGIGTAGPTSLLELSKTDASPILTITSATSTTTYDPYIAFRTGATPSIQSLIGIDYSDSNKLKLVRGSDIATSTGITIDSSGNVGIGMTSPGTKVEVNVGGINFDGVTVSGVTDNIGFSLKNIGSGGRWYSIFSTAGTSGTGQGRLSFQDRIAGLDRMVIDPNGNVGIGTTTPVSRLEVKGSTTDSTASGLNITDSAGTSRLYVRNDGNVGIGTTTPGAKLDVYSSDTTIPLRIKGTTNYPTLFQYLKPDGSNLFRGQWDGSNFHHYMDGSIHYNLNGYEVTFDGNGNTASQVRVASGASFKVDPNIDGSSYGINSGDFSYATVTTQLTKNYPLLISTWAWNGTNGSSIRSNTSFRQTQLSTTAGDARFGIANNSDTEVLSILTTSGNVGIGTTGPTSLLELSKTDASPILTITSATSTTTYDPYIAFRTGATPSIQSLIGIDYSDANKLKLVRGSDIATSTGITIDSSGNVGIGTTTPVKTLDVQGAIELNLPGSGTGNALCHTTQTGTTNEEIVDCTSSPVADYAEMYPTASDVLPGDIVVASSHTITTLDGETLSRLDRSSVPYQDALIGVISDPTKATDFNVIGYSIRDEDHPLPLALNGRVSVRVSGENGPVHIGDPLTSSSRPGVAMKATKAGKIIGHALADFTSDSPSAIGNILVFVNLTYYIGDVAQMNTAKDADDNGFFGNLIGSVKNSISQLTGTIAAGGEWIFNRITAAFIKTDTIQVDKGILIQDAVTHEYYCVTIQNGEFVKIKGECGNVVLTPTPAPSESHVPTPAPTATPLTSESPTPTISSEITPESTPFSGVLESFEPTGSESDSPVEIIEETSSTDIL